MHWHSAAESVQKHWFGVCERRKILHDTRAEFERIVHSIDGPNVHVSWRSSGSLCQPFVHLETPSIDAGNQHDADDDAYEKKIGERENRGCVHVADDQGTGDASVQTDELSDHAMDDDAGFNSSPEELRLLYYSSGANAAAVTNASNGCENEGNQYADAGAVDKDLRYEFGGRNPEQSTTEVHSAQAQDESKDKAAADMPPAEQTRNNEAETMVAELQSMSREQLLSRHNIVLSELEWAQQALASRRVLLRRRMVHANGGR